mgnify:CR=1 FL=1
MDDEDLDSAIMDTEDEFTDDDDDFSEDSWSRYDECTAETLSFSRTTKLFKIQASVRSAGSMMSS